MLSHPGRVRHANEDASGATPECGAFVVCDGMGGAAAGEVASHLAVEAFLASLAGPCRTRSRTRSAPSSGATPAAGHPVAGHVSNGSHPYPVGHPHARLEEAVKVANHAVFRYSQKSRGLRGMGTTLVAALCEDSTLWLVHVGDSRCYRLRAGTLELLTQDHSLVEEQIQAGLLSRLEANSSPVRNIITRAIGSQPTVEPEIASHPTQSGDLYLLASDGLTRELADAEIAAILRRAHTDPAGLEAICQALIDAANHKGGGDNITVLLLPIP